MAPVDTVEKQGSRFQKGRSGNPNGRPKGSRNAATLACEGLFEGQAEALTQKAIQMALEGDTVALKICLDRICPVQKSRPVRFALPPINNARDAADLMAAVVEAVAAGQVTPDEAAEIGKVIDAYVRAYQTAEMNEPSTRIEQFSDEELLRIMTGGRVVEAVTPISRLLTLRPR
jgi:Family of unknown function (DUF5681)